MAVRLDAMRSEAKRGLNISCPVLNIMNISSRLQDDTAALLKRIEALESGARFDATKEAVQQVQMECLTTLRNLRTTMKEEGGSSASNKEMEALKAENELLKKKNAKQAYRIQHLVGTVEELLAQKQQSAS